MMKVILEQLFAQQPLSAPQAEEVLQAIIGGELPPESIGALLGSIQTRGATASELAGFARALRQKMHRVALVGPTLDTCGTGGDGGHTFNVSTAVALLVASLGVRVVKHGNRAVSSQSGSADVLEALGIPLQQSPESVSAAVERDCFGFCFAPAFHPALKEVALLRRNLGVRTVFNLLGPLCNPAEVSHQVLGVYDPKLTQVLAEVLQQLGTTSALVVSSLDGLDELSLSAPTRATQLQHGQITTLLLTPEDAGLATQSMKAVRGGSPAENAAILKALFAGEKGPARDLVLYNAAAALWVYGAAENLQDGARLAAEALDQGKATGLLERLQTL